MVIGHFGNYYLNLFFIFLIMMRMQKTTAKAFDEYLLNHAGYKYTDYFNPDTGLIRWSVVDDEYALLTDMFFDTLTFMRFSHLMSKENLLVDLVKELHYYAKTRLETVENAWQYARYEQIRDGSVPPIKIR